MRFRTHLCCAALFLLAPLTAVAEPSVDLRRGVPAEAHLAALGWHNPERDYQREHFAEVWQTIQEEEICERFVKIITSRIPEDKLAEASAVLDELRAAVGPLSCEQLLDTKQVAYAAVMQFPATDHLILVQTTPEAAESFEASVKNLFALVERYSEGEVPVESEQRGSVSITKLGLPDEVPMHPVVIRWDDVLVISSSIELAENSLARLQGGEGVSKFDDPRLVEALSQLPEPEDSLTFFDGKQLFSKLDAMGDFVREKKPDDEDALRIAHLMERAMEEFALVDYEVTVETTEGNQNRTAVAGKVLLGIEDRLMLQALTGAEPFEQWQNWVPADAVAYSLSGGINLHNAYARILAVLAEEMPESQAVLEQFEQMQAEWGIHIDRDILQAFSGESVSVTLPAEMSGSGGGHDSVFALRCHQPERILELLHRLVDTLVQIPAVEAQQLEWEACEDLEGFEQLRANFFAMLGVQPVVGFQEGWMILGSNESAVQRVLDARTGGGETILQSENFQRFGMPIQGPVRSLSYADLAENTHHAAQVIRQISAVAPVIVGMIGADADAEEIQPVLELIGLLPSVANIVEKFDFFEARLSVVQAGDLPGTYSKQSVTLVRPLESGEEESAEAVLEAVGSE